MTFEKKWAYSSLCTVVSQKNHQNRHFKFFINLNAGHIKVLGGQYMARGPGVAQA